MTVLLKFSLLILFCSMTIGCATSGQYSLQEAVIDFEEPPITSGTDFTRKILFSGFITISVSEPEQANDRIKEIAEQFEGYVNRIGTTRSEIRVKSQHFESAIDQISKLGKVQSKNMVGEDVTDNYLDYQIRLDNARQARERYLQLLENAENVEAALKVERELERLNETIDLLTGRMNRIDHLSEYSTITINIREEIKPGVLGYVVLGLYNSVKWLFVRN